MQQLPEPVYVLYCMAQRLLCGIFLISSTNIAGPVSLCAGSQIIGSGRTWVDGLLHVSGLGPKLERQDLAP
jgi:hypothetical protein